MPGTPNEFSIGTKPLEPGLAQDTAIALNIATITAQATTRQRGEGSRPVGNSSSTKGNIACARNHPKPISSSDTSASGRAPGAARNA
jgi:hypothetical protein